MVRKIVCSAALAVGCLLGEGCMGGPCASWGYRYELYKPPIITGSPQVTPVVMGSQSDLVSMDHTTTLGAVRGPLPAEGAVVQESSRRRGSVRVTAAPTVAEVAPGGSCTWEDVCRILHRIEAHINATSTPPASMPRGAP